jgi:hypothetical protein
VSHPSRPTGAALRGSPDPSGNGPRSPVLPGWAARAAAAVYAAALGVITLAPIRWGDLARYRDNWRPQLVPIWGMVANLRDGDRDLAILAGAAGNVALFLPLGFLLPQLEPRLDRPWRTLAGGLLASSAIELCQMAFPGVRRADVNDVLLNTLGTALGFLAYRLAARAGRGRRVGSLRA